MSESGDKLTRFMEGFAAASELARRAEDRLQHIEFICLAASIIDGLLRMGLILRHQIDTKSTDVLDDLLYQSDTDRIVGEREIYRRAAKRGVIGREVFQALGELYGRRNRVVHRYIISEITTADVAGIAHDFRRMLSVVSHAVWLVEDEQVRLGVGMTSRVLPGTDPDVTTAQMAARKHANTSRIILPRR
jgi:uncharacterized protein YutE (UPF0331/DUF86 family)